MGRGGGSHRKQLCIESDIRVMLGLRLRGEDAKMKGNGGWGLEGRKISKEERGAIDRATSGRESKGWANPQMCRLDTFMRTCTSRKNRSSRQRRRSLSSPCPRSVRAGDGQLTTCRRPPALRHPHIIYPSATLRHPHITHSSATLRHPHTRLGVGWEAQGATLPAKIPSRTARAVSSPSSTSTTCCPVCESCQINRETRQKNPTREIAFEIGPESGAVVKRHHHEFALVSYGVSAQSNIRMRR